MRASTTVALASAVLGVAVASAVVGQSLKPDEVPVFGTGVTVVAVPVFVTDKGGKAVPGLTAEDFEIEDQGKKVPILAFHAVDAASALPAGEAGTLVQAAARRQFLLLFDLTFSSPIGIMRAREGATGFVRESLLPSDLAAVATFSQSGVRVILGFTSDHGQLARAIDTLGVLETERVRDPLNIAYDLGLPPDEIPGRGTSPPPEGRQAEMVEHLRDMAKQMSRTDQAVYRQRVDGFLGGLEQLSRMLDGVQGRKQVVLLSAGFDSTVLGGAQGQERVEASQAVTEGRLWDVQGDRYFGDATARDALDKLFQALAASDTVLHTVDVTGLAAGASAEESVGARASQGRDTLAQFAINTGGRFIKDANDLRRGLDEILGASRHYYVLAFEPVSSRKPGRLQKLKVRVKRAGLEVSHRRGYTIADPKRVADPVDREMQAAEVIAKGLSGGPIALRAVAVPYRGEEGRLSLPVVLEIDGRALLGGGASKGLKLEIFGYALDEAGRIYDAVGLAPGLDIGAARASLEAKGLQVLTSFAVPDGPVDLRFLVREPGSGRAGSLRLRLAVPAFDEERLVLSPPLAMDDPRSRLVLPAPSRALPDLDIPFRLEDTPFTLEPLPTLRNGVEREVCVMTWTGSADFSTESAFEITADLVDAAGAARGVGLGGPPRVVPDVDGLQRHVLALTPQDVPTGRYALRVSFRDPSSGKTGTSELPVQVQ